MLWMAGQMDNMKTVAPPSTPLPKKQFQLESVGRRGIINPIFNFSSDNLLLRPSNLLRLSVDGWKEGFNNCQI